MHASTTSSDTNSAKAVALCPRLEAINAFVKTSSANPALIDATLKMGMAYAIFLTEVVEGTTTLAQDQVTQMLERTEQHCALYESEFPVVVSA
ncbi:hypothetical protein [Pseudomonas fragi]|uniref:hypothetical protein n=1 Tax=Pseudomonas fragi TaxID=296 RepID=UPI0014745B5E|nr:hypothetical protein [Pseudomonas fragi]NNB33956.1 hypothetical protein [Pseudomonas fragi]